MRPHEASGESEPPQQPDSSSLDLLRQSAPENSCVSRTHHLLNVSTGEAFPLRCRRHRCLECSHLEVWWKQQIISHGGNSGPPTKFITLTRAPADWQPLRKKISKFMTEIRSRTDRPFEMAWTVELSPKNQIPHVHGLVKSRYVRQELLQDAWGSIIDIRAIRGPQNAPAGYVLKEARQVADYALKTTQADLDAHMALNGGRLVHLSRGYLGGMRQEEVRRTILEDRNDEEADQWALVRI